LAAVGSDFPGPPPEHPNVLGVVVDIPRPDGIGTLVALTDNTTSLYQSLVTGVFIPGGLPWANDSLHRLLAVAEGHLGLLERETDESLPGRGHVRFHVVTLSGRLRADVPEVVFWEFDTPHPLRPLVEAAQELIGLLSEFHNAHLT
jgi:hypothetical protein